MFHNTSSLIVYFGDIDCSRQSSGCVFLLLFACESLLLRDRRTVPSDGGGGRTVPLVCGGSETVSSVDGGDKKVLSVGGDGGGGKVFLFAFLVETVVRDSGGGVNNIGNKAIVAGYADYGVEIVLEK